MPQERFLQITADGGLQPSRDFESMTASFFGGPLNVVGSGSLAGRAAFNGSAVGSTYVDTDADPWEFYIHTAAGDNWSGPETFVDSTGITALRTEVVDDFLGGNENLAIETAASIDALGDAVTASEADSTAALAQVSAHQGQLDALQADLDALPSEAPAGYYWDGSVTSYTTAGAFTWTRPDGCVAAHIQVQAPGGSGAGSAGITAQASFGSGGGAGEYAESFITIAEGLGATETVTIGAVAAAPTAGANNGNDGVACSFGAHVVANPGGGGIAMASATSNVSSGGGATGSGGTGDVKFPGGAGQRGIRHSGTQGFSGTGGDSQWGRGGAGVTNAAGIASVGWGGGGGGAASTDTTDRAGAAGGPGRILVRPYF